MFKHLRASGLAVAAALAASFGASAEPASYVFRGDITGVLGGLDVSGPLTLTVTGDTDDVFVSGNSSWLTTNMASTFELAGFGSFTVTNPSYLFVNRAIPALGFGVTGMTVCCDIIQHRVPIYGGYDLLSSIGPVTANANTSLGTWQAVPTTAGLFAVTSMTNNVFEARVSSAVPEPGALALFSVGSVGVLSAVARRRRRMGTQG